MRLFPVFLVAVATTLCFQAAHAQTTSEGWMRVKSDNGGFSIDVPQDHKYFTDRDGFSIGNGGGDLPLLNMRMVSAFTENTLVSFEVYNVKKVALNNLFDSDKQRKGVTDVKREKVNGFEIKQIETKSDDFFSIRKYFASKNHIYILTAASRDSEPLQ